MRRLLSVELGERSYPLAIGAGLLADPESYAELRGKTLRIVTDANVAARYLDPVLDALNLTREHAFVLPAGELQKTWANAEQVLDWLLASRIARDGVLIALGGGVIGDLTGFVASIYQRGIAFVQMPTTLLSQVDSSVGGKTGVNHARGKNLIGAFHQPIAVFADTDTLNTLPPRELSAGLAEVIKCGMLGDAALFARLERDIDAILTLDPNAVAEAVERCCKLKARIVALDERESLAGGPRTLLNLGHTFGHAVETFTKYETWLHGEAVGLGLAMAADMSMRLGWLKAEDAERCLKLIERAKLPIRPPAAMTPDDFRSLMARDKKVAAGKLRLVLMRAIGEAATTADFDVAALDATLGHFCTPADASDAAIQAA
ncbi:3-dehydroquinate synthase [Nevskia ramosa]|uniref:3-dehydroquinate synthase n=1 Tax=Nevskia ramosa TaxID=64002 RepID=UPI0003B3A0A1|nr:3-dehydroquinate synthase [Nevskia ramosa]